MRVLSGAVRERDLVQVVGTSAAPTSVGLFGNPEMDSACGMDEGNGDSDDGERELGVDGRGVDAGGSSGGVGRSVRGGKSAAQRIQRLSTAFGCMRTTQAQLDTGAVGLVTGLRDVKAGDMLVHGDDPVAESIAQQVLAGGASPVSVLFADAPDAAHVQLPQPVYVATVEASEPSQEQALHEALHVLGMEDATLHVSVERTTSAIVLSTVGELQMQVVRDSLSRRFGLTPHFGPLRCSWPKRYSLRTM